MARRVMGWTLLAALALSLLLPSVPLLAQEEPSEEAVATTLQVRDAEGERTAVEGARIEVFDEDGELVGEGTTDAEGNFELSVPGPGVYTLVLDVTTLPEGVFLRSEGGENATTEVELGQTGLVIFGLVTEERAEDIAARGGFSLRQLLQLTVEGLKLGLILGMAAIGLSLIFGTTGLVNFAHGEMVTWGMLVAYFFNFFGLAGAIGFMADWPAPFGAGMNLVWAAGFAILLGAWLGWSLDRYVFGPLRARGVSLIAAMVVSIGLSIFLRYLFLFLFGGTPRFFADFTAQSALQLGLIQITPKDLTIGALAIVILVGVGVFLQTTKLGTAMRAVSDNRDLAESSGIDVQRVIRFVWLSGGALAGLGGVFLGLSEQVSWNIGFRTLLLVFAGTILGGLGTAYGALLGSLLVGVGIQVSTIWMPTELKNVGALVVLILVLLVRPQGLLGKAERIG